MSVLEGTEQPQDVTSIVLHPDYDSGTTSSDISLLKISSALTYDDYVAAIPIPSQGQTFTGNAVVSGWGTLTEGGDTPTVLQSVTVPFVTDAQCKADYGAGNVDDTMICAGESGKDSCQGDSGGPLAANGVLAGIVSWGYGCARPNFPGVYTRVSYFVDWIEANA